MTRPNVILMGSKPGASAALQILQARGWNILYVVTTKRQEARWLPGPTLVERALENNIPVCLQENLSEDTEVDFVISYMYRNLVRPPVLAVAKRAAINFHAAPLPRFGGWAFYNVAILEKANQYGCTCHYMNEKFDEGPLLKVRTFPIDPAKETAVTLERKAQREMIQLFVEFCEIAESGADLPLEHQVRSEMRYMDREEFQKLKQIPIDADAETIDRIARAFWYPPYAGAFMMLGDRKIEVFPEAAREHAAEALHRHDLNDLMQVNGER